MEENQIIVEGSSHVKTVTLNKPQKLNALSHHMILLLIKELRPLENDPNVKLVIIKGKGRAFCAGGDASAIVRFITIGHWSFGAHFYKKQFTLDYMIATYEKPLVFLINGAVMGGGAGFSMNGRYRIVTENTVFAMPEATIGLFPDVGASYFLSRLPGFFGEYLGLSGARLDGTEMLACGLATHFVLSKNLVKLEESLNEIKTHDASIITRIIDQYGEHPPLKKESSYLRVDIINKCFSKGTVEEILASLEQENVHGQDDWITATVKSIKQASPISLKLFLRSIREGRRQTYEECIRREYRMLLHVLRKTVTTDYFEGIGAKFLDKNRKPKWDPPSLDLVSDDKLDKYFGDVDKDEDWPELDLPSKTNFTQSLRAKL